MSGKYYAVYKRLFIQNAVKLFFCSLNFNFINFFAVLFFSRTKKRTRLLAFANQLLNKKICRCQRLNQKCEYLENKLKKYNKKYAPV